MTNIFSTPTLHMYPKAVKLLEDL